jgi:hypothetical protein
LLTGEKPAIHSKLNQLILTLPLRLGGLNAVGRLCVTYFFYGPPRLSVKNSPEDLVELLIS